MRLKIVETQNAVLTGVFVINLLRQFCQNRHCDAHLLREQQPLCLETGLQQKYQGECE